MIFSKKINQNLKLIKQKIDYDYYRDQISFYIMKNSGHLIESN